MSPPRLLHIHDEMRLIFTSHLLSAISLNVNGNTRGKVPRLVLWGKWRSAPASEDRARRAIHLFFFHPLSPLLNGNGELRLRFMDGVTLWRSAGETVRRGPVGGGRGRAAARNFGFTAARLIVRHRRWTAKCTAGAPPSNHATE